MPFINKKKDISKKTSSLKSSSLKSKNLKPKIQTKKTTKPIYKNIKNPKITKAIQLYRDFYHILQELSNENSITQGNAYELKSEYYQLVKWNSKLIDNIYKNAIRIKRN